MIFPIVAVNPGWEVVALLSDDTGIPRNAVDRLKVFGKIMVKAKEYGIFPSRIHIDPLMEMLCTSENGIETNTTVISAVREAYPPIHRRCQQYLFQPASTEDNQKYFSSATAEYGHNRQRH